MTLYLHIGMNKTGSSAIQRYLSTNRDALAVKGLLYPKTGCLGHAHYGLSSLLGFEHSKPFVVDLNSSAVHEEQLNLQREIEKYRPRDIVISSEFFVLPRSIHDAKVFFADYDVKVVIYLRRHDKWWPSAYNQAVRTVASPPWGRTFKAYLKFFSKKRPWVGDYRLLIDSWADVFGKENIVVRPYEAQQNKPGLIADFMKTIGAGAIVNELVPNDSRVNGSIDLSTLYLVDAYQRAQITPEIRRELIHRVLQDKQFGERESGHDPHLLYELASKYEDDYAYIAREYLGRKDGLLYYDTLPDTTKPWSKVKSPPLDSVVGSIVSIMQGMTYDGPTHPSIDTNESGACNE